MKSTMKRCLALATVLAMLLSVCALPVFAVTTIAAPCEHVAVEGAVTVETVIITHDDNTHSRYDRCVCTVEGCGAKWIENVVLNEAHDYEDVETKAPWYSEFEVDPVTGEIITETVMEEVGGQLVPVTKPVVKVDGRGIITPTCMCGATKEVVYIDALTHGEDGNPSDDCCVRTVVTPATCDEPGEYTYVCKNNGAHPLTGGEIPALGHKYELGDYIAATETEGAKVKVDCANGCGGYTIDVVAEAPAHENCAGTIESATREGTCVDYAITLYACEACKLTYAMGYTAAAGHNTDGVYEYTAHSCTDAHVTVKYCTACVTIANNNEADEKLLVEDAIWNVADANGKYGLYAKETVAPATGHYYMDGETVVAIDPDVHNDDVVCADCGATFGHVWVDMENPATCTEPGASWKKCECGEETAHAPIAPLNHTEILDEENSYAATEVADGLNVYICETCGEELRREVIAAAYDIVFTAAAKNQFNGSVYVQNSIVAYTISLNAANLAVGNMRLAVSYNAALTYMGYDLGADNANAFGAYAADGAGTTSVGATGGVVTVFAYSANYAEGALAPVVLDGAQEFVTLYFAVNSDAAVGDYALAITNYEIENVDLATNYVIKSAADVTVAVETLGDLNDDNAITIEDQILVNKLIASSMNESAALYDVHADINQDGAIDFEDLYVVNQYLNTSYTLEELLAVGDIRPAQNA